jgi:DNA-binding transcriptional LysR family regulator
MTPSIDFRRLRYFLAVAEELHFGRAAARLGIAQPPLSQQIQRLERELDTQLFVRTRRTVSLTDAGRALMEETRSILINVQGAISRVARAGRGETGVISVGFAASVMFQELPRIIRRFRTQYPDVRLDLRELPTALQLTGLRVGDLDVGFVREPAPDPTLHLETVLREPLLIAVGKDHRLAARSRIRLQDLSQEDFVLFPEDVAPGLHRQVLALCQNAGFVPRVVQVSRELHTTVSLVAAGVGVTIIPGSVTKMGSTGVRYQPIRSVRVGTRIDMAWRVDNARPVLNAFLGVVRNINTAAPR